MDENSNKTDKMTGSMINGMASMICRCCGRPLKDPDSINIGIGPVCRMESKAAEASDPNGSIFGPRADYSHVVECGIVCITDNDNGKSVTNDVENVLKDLVGFGYDLDNLKVIYRDTMGIWDEIVVKNRLFLEFRNLGERSRLSAMEKVKRGITVKLTVIERMRFFDQASDIIRQMHELTENYSFNMDAKLEVAAITDKINAMGFKIQVK